jgi:UDP-glucose 4-epimerase
MTWLLTGGAGYIGAHVLRSLRANGHEVVVLDDLSTGVPGKVPSDVPLVAASVLDGEAVHRALVEHRVTGVIHLAAKKAVEESVQQPLWYFEENVEGFRRLLAAMRRAEVGRLVLSSTAAVYGMPDVDLVTEDAPLEPINPYGYTKVACEWMARAMAESDGLRTVFLRYFNVAGAGGAGLGDPTVANLVPLILRALAADQQPVVFGDDYPTADGTCIRDYIHVQDLAEAHVAAATAVDAAATPAVYNVSRGVGSSVREVMEVAGEVTGLPVHPRVGPRRAGDPARLVGSADAMERELGWRARFDLRDMIASAWEAAAERGGAADALPPTAER